MHTTRKAIAERVGEIDVVIELLDARLPGSSANPMLAALTIGKPTVKILNKQDLADATQTAAWLAHYNAQPGTQAFGLDASVNAPLQHLRRACNLLARTRGSMSKPMRVLICGIPNVGKSTLINTLTGKRSAKTGDEAGVTRITQRITLADGFYLFDTPGVLWPKIAVAQSGYNLAASGAIGKNAYEEVDVAMALLAYLQNPYAAELVARYQLESPAAVAAMGEEDLLAAIGRKRAALQAGNKVNLQKAAEIVIHDFRSGAMGRITLETPGEFGQWLLQAEAQAAKKEALKDAQKGSNKVARQQKRK